MTPKYRDEVDRILANLNSDSNHQEEPQTNIPNPNSTEEIEDIYVLILRENPDLAEPTVIDSTATDLETTPLTARPAPQTQSNAATGIVPFGAFVTLLCLMCIMAQCYFIFNPFTVNVTLAERSQQLSLTGTLQLGRVLNPITVSQSQTVPTTGKGHQDARAATGYITFYNGQLQSVFIPAGTTLTGNSSVQIVTDADANIPAADPTANPPVFGQTRVPAYSGNKGSAGNIPAYDISQPCCAQSVIAKNLQSFTGGQDERNYQTVTKSDIDNTAAPLKSDLSASLQGVLQRQLKQGEQLQTLPCSPTVTPDHQIGTEATNVKVTVSETCSGIAYNDQELTGKVTQLLTTQEAKKLETGYSLLGNPQITVTSATTTKPVILSFRSISTWIYALSSAEQKHIKTIIAGKTKEQAIQLLHGLPGIERVSMQSSGFRDDSRVPKNVQYIHLVILAGI